MTRPQLMTLKKTLAARRADLAREVLQSRASIRVERSADLFEDLQGAEAREFAITELQGRCAMLLEIDAALRRIDDGSYGECLHCEEPIAPRRLAALPWAALCINCQEALDRGEPALLEFSEALYRRRAA